MTDFVDRVADLVDKLLDQGARFHDAVNSALDAYAVRGDAREPVRREVCARLGQRGSAARKVRAAQAAKGQIPLHFPPPAKQ